MMMSVVYELDNVSRTIKKPLWWILVTMVIAMVEEVHSLNGPNVCIVKQKYNVTKLVKYRAPMVVRTYEWCFSMPPRCSRLVTEMRDLTRHETEERVAEMAVCCAGYKMKDISCVPICPYGKTGHGCSEVCPPKKWGPNCVHDCKRCDHGTCSPVTGDCLCQQGWQGESCANINTTTPASMMEQILTKATKTASASTLDTSRMTETLTTKTTPVLVTRTTFPVTANTRTSTENPMQPSTITGVVYSTTTQTSLQPTSKSIIEFRNTTTSLIPHKQTFETTYDSIQTESTLSNVTAIFSTTLIPFTTRTFTRAPSTTWTTERSTLTTSSARGITTVKPESTRKTDTTIKQTTMKFKPKEIWIKPAQKGEPIIDKHKINHEKHKNFTSKDFIFEATTPKTIIVSIIPTSVTYTSFKRIALSTTLQRNVTTIKSSEEFTKPMSHTTSKPFVTKMRYVEKTTPMHQNVTKIPLTSATTEKVKPTISIYQNTNSMSTNEVQHLSSNSLTSPSISTNFTQSMVSNTRTMTLKSTTRTAITPTNTIFTTKPQFRSSDSALTQKPAPKATSKEGSKNNLTKTNIETNTVTDDPTKDKETFHILTEPEHITAVMGDKTNEKSSANLISVISIAGGVMMSLITVAIVIVMLERCKRPNYEGSRKYNDISMQEIIDDKNDVPPPYVRSIFHTPLPDPPTSEKCHYQPISTLDRNLKQFMRPVVVQTISPLMLENFRGILECHYDHLPRRSQDYDPVPTRHSLTPSIEESEKLLEKRSHSITDSTIDALKCEAKLDIIDSTTSEPLYAEIPCWRPPSEQHAVEVINTNGEAVTEL